MLRRVYRLRGDGNPTVECGPDNLDDDFFALYEIYFNDGSLAFDVELDGQ